MIQANTKTWYRLFCCRFDQEDFFCFYLGTKFDLIRYQGSQIRITIAILKWDPAFPGHCIWLSCLCDLVFNTRLPSFFYCMTRCKAFTLDSILSFILVSSCYLPAVFLPSIQSKNFSILFICPINRQLDNNIPFSCLI